MNGRTPIVSHAGSELQKERLPIQLRPLRIELDDGVAKKQNTDSDKQGVQDFLQLLELRLLVAKGVDHYENCQNELEDQLCEQPTAGGLREGGQDEVSAGQDHHAPAASTRAVNRTAVLCARQI